MIRSLLKSKIHDARVTATKIDYVGSITLDKKLIDAAGLCVFEKVLVADISNGNRFETYIIEGGEGEVELNGAAAKLTSVGDKLIIMAFGLVDEKEIAGHEPIIISLNENNEIL